MAKLASLNRLCRTMVALDARYSAPARMLGSRTTSSESPNSLVARKIRMLLRGWSLARSSVVKPSGERP